MLLFSDLLILLNISSILVFVVRNPVSAALWLIITFFNSSVLLWLINSEFFALIYIIIYVGAIAVLFLFVIMMLDIKSLDSNISFLHFYSSTWYIKLLNLFLFFIPTILISYVFSYFFFFEPNNIDDFFLNSFDLLNNLQAIGQTIYNSYTICLILAGLILLVAIIGAIVLTLDVNNNNNKIKQTSKQLSRSTNFLSFFK